MTQAPAGNAAQMRRLLALARDLLQAPDLTSVLALVGRAGPEVLQADGILLLVVMGEREYIAEFDRHGVSQPAPADSELLRHARQAMADETPVLLPEAVADRDRLDDGVSQETVSMLALPFPPIKPVGVLAALWCRRGRQNELSTKIPTVRHLGELTGAALGNVGSRWALEGKVESQSREIAEAVRQHASELLRRDGIEEEIHRISVTDVMTGLLNRRGFFLHAERSLKVARRQGLPSALIFFDIDGLKKVNDEFGHDAGDHLIENAARILQESFRGSDVVARLGGDEFAAFTLDAAQPDLVVARMQRSIDGFSLRSPQPYRISFSFGIAQCDPLSDLSLSDCLSQADRRMYEQKAARRK